MNPSDASAALQQPPGSADATDVAEPTDRTHPNHQHDELVPPRSDERTEPAPQETYVLKHQDTFLVADEYGDVHGGRDGLFRDDTRVLSRFVLTFGGRTPSLLSSSVSRDNVVFVSHLTNHPLPRRGGEATPEGVLHVERTRFLWRECLHERIVCHNYGNTAASTPLSLCFDADFRDMFEVRGTPRARHGERLAPRFAPNGVTLRYLGLDNAERSAALRFSARPDRLEAGRADFVITLLPDASFTLYIEIGTDAGAAAATATGRATGAAAGTAGAIGAIGATEAAPDAAQFRRALLTARLAMRRHRQHTTTIRSSSGQFNGWLERSLADLALLSTDLPTGPYPYAGIPWFSTPFGRDGITTALQTLWLDPSLARGVLRYLASRQATESSSFRDAEPGKIMHETRRGEMCVLNELPFGLYYGGVDSTPLFVVLAGAYAERTGDLNLIDELWPALCRAIGWVERVQAASPNGLLDYARGESTGLANQGWKDSEDSVFHADGTFPRGPIALVEVQGYAFRAFTALGQLAARRGDAALAERWGGAAQRIRDLVEQKYWMPHAGFYGIALDGDGRLCETLTSNAGQLLFSGLPSPEHARRVAAQLLSSRFYSGWGVRTLATGQPRFNPMSYHDGSVWPHDTALCAAGMRHYGELGGPVELLDALQEAAVQFDMRLPELFCGFPRTAGEPPVGYPVACLPQAWAAGAAPMLLQAVLGITIDGWTHSVTIDRPQLPSGVTTLSLRHLQIGCHRLDLTFTRENGGVVAYIDGALNPALHVHGATVRANADAMSPP